MSIRIASLVLATMAVAGCTQSLDFDLPPNDSLKLDLYQHGMSVETCAIAPGSTQFNKLQALLASNQSQWAPTPVTYAPSVLVTGKNVSFNFVQDSVIFSKSGRQLSHRVPRSAYAFLRCEDGT
jgi:hypothetical protein